MITNRQSTEPDGLAPDKRIQLKGTRSFSEPNQIKELSEDNMHQNQAEPKTADGKDGHELREGLPSSSVVATKEDSKLTVCIVGKESREETKCSGKQLQAYVVYKITVNMSGQNLSTVFRR